jgi:hypothetical protein
MRRLFEMIGNPDVSPSRISDELYLVLDAPSRAAIDARAKALSTSLGAAVAPVDILQLRGTVANRRVSRVELVSQSEDRATLSLTFEPIAFMPATPSNDPKDGPSSMKVEVVKEGERWRIAFTDLDKLVHTLPLAAKGSAQ